jgi:hypothetical protein
MSLTQDFISSIPSKVQGRIYLASQPGYKIPRLQIISFHDNPAITKLRATIPGLPCIINNGLQWMTVSDGQYSITACLNPERQYMYETRQIKENSIIYLTGYGTEPNNEEAIEGRPIRLVVGAFEVERSNFPERIGNPVDLYDATTKIGVVAKADPALAYHALLDLTPRAVERIQSAENCQICVVPGLLRLQVTSIKKADSTCWHLILSDGIDAVRGSMSHLLELADLGVAGRQKNNLAAIMINTAKGLKVNDVISFSEYMVLDDDSKKKMAILYNCDVVYKAK